MKKFVGAVVGVCLAIALASHGHAAEKQLTPQQERMKSCNEEAGAKKLSGADRSKFMSSCLKGDAAAPAMNAQQERMKSCNASASEKALKGADRKKFMSECLKAN